MTFIIYFYHMKKRNFFYYLTIKAALSLILLVASVIIFDAASLPFTITGKETLNGGETIISAAMLEKNSFSPQLLSLTKNQTNVIL